MKTREEIMKGLQTQYKNEFAGNYYPDEFKADGFMNQCNFGGLLIILSTTGESVIVWLDWSDAAVSETLTECEIEFFDSTDEDGNDTLEYRFTFQDSRYNLNDFIHI
jgi:hypothetical protein